MRTRFFAMVGALAALSAAPAAAQSCVILPVAGEFELVAAHSMELTTRVRSAFEDSGVEVLDEHTAVARLDAVAAPHCEEASCAAAMLGVLHAAFAVATTIRHASGLVQIEVAMIDPDGNRVSGSADGAEDSVGQAVQAALAQARAHWSTRAGSPVHVAGSPEGATITVDGASWGAVPHDGRLQPGAHRVAVAAPGHATEARDVVVSADGAPLELTFALTAATSGPDVGLLIAGIATSAVGVAGLAVGIATAAAPEHCTEHCDGPPAARTIFVPSTDVGIALTIAGAAVLAAGIVLTIIGVSTGGSHAGAASLGPDGFTLHF